MESSYNGWPASPDPDAIGIDRDFTAGGVTFPGGVKSGDVATVFRDLVEQYVATVEPLTDGWCWGYSFRANVNNPNTLSCHSSGTALDLNAPLHANGASGTMPNGERSARALVDRYGGLITWGGDFTGTPDEMHWEVSGSAAELAELADRLSAGNGPEPEPEEEDVPLTSEEVHRIADEVMRRLQQTEVIAMLVVDPETGKESNDDASITRALQSAQTQAARAAYRA